MCSAIARSSGLPVPFVGDLIETNGRFGLILERIEGHSMWRHIDMRLWALSRSARLLARLHTKCHAASRLSELPDQRQRLVDNIQNAESIPVRMKEVLMQTLAGMFGGDQFCQGDFHPGNILLVKGGPTIIDWIDASVGNSIADVARTWVWLSQGSAPCLSIPWFNQPLLRWFRELYLTYYLKLGHCDKKQLIEWIRVVAARLNEKMVPEVQDRLLDLATAGDPLDCRRDLCLTTASAGR